ncbi:hypothetical protein POM88_009097 [Heracleum sosnowskyi]|uniref:Uncharacterized protein n=1 Tax=Heracleum sosnowskyi TaxID=360622 RepID=A0AAD8J833_9APIA|nr:hypothetical protein POM88_009097 [Heracleum sosnowskyi]
MTCLCQDICTYWGFAHGVVVCHLLEESRWTNESMSVLVIGLSTGVFILLFSAGRNSHLMVAMNMVVDFLNRNGHFQALEEYEAEVQNAMEEEVEGMSEWLVQTLDRQVWVYRTRRVCMDSVELEFKLLHDGVDVSLLLSLF